MEVNEQDSHELTAPLQYFVEVGTFTHVSGAAPAEGTVITKKFQGQTLAGDAWIPIMCYRDSSDAFELCHHDDV